MACLPCVMPRPQSLVLQKQTNKSNTRFEYMLRLYDNRTYITIKMKYEMKFHTKHRLMLIFVSVGNSAV